MAGTAPAGITTAWDWHFGNGQRFSAGALHEGVQRRFQVRAAQPGTAFLPRGGQNLDLIFSLQFEGTVNRDNTVSFLNLALQLEPVRWQATLAGCTVWVHQHLDGTLPLTHRPQRLGRYNAEGMLMHKTPARRAVEKPLGGKVKSRRSHRAWKSRKPRGIFTFPQLRRLLVNLRTGHILCYQTRTF